jgi:hypothetical protein
MQYAQRVGAVESSTNGEEHSERGSDPTAGWVVIGREMARAVEADQRHRREHGDAPSPLDGIA